MEVPDPPPKKYGALPYRIVYCSGEDPGHPASELLIPGKHCRGWESPADAYFPQEIVLQFMGVIGLRQVQFLSHQAKIASKIELLVYAPDEGDEAKLPTPDELEKLKFKKLGHITLGTNDDNGYTARELKTVTLNKAAFYLRIRLFGSYSNGLNIHRQVGILAINCFGEETFHLEADKPSSSPDEGPEIELDEKTLETLNKLEESKQRALSVENFDKAREIKEAMIKFRTMAKQLAMLEYKKAQAIQSEDYPSAKIIKVEIERLRGSVWIDKEEPVSRPTVQAISAAQNVVPLTEDLIMDPSKKPKPEPTVSTSEDVENKHLYKNTYAKISGKVEPAEPLIRNPLKGRGGKKPLPQEPQDEDTGEDHKQGPTKAEALAGKAKKYAESYYSSVQLDLLEMLFSKSWGNRDAALNILKEELLDEKFVKVTAKGREKILTTILGLMSHVIPDNVVQVAVKAMAIVDIGLAFYPSEVQENKAMFHANVESCLVALMERIGDTNAKVRNKAHETCLKLALNSNVGMKGIVGHIANGAKKQAGAVKHLQGKLKLLAELVQTYGLETKSPITKSVIDLAMLGAKHSTAEIRNEGYSLLVEVYKLLGAQIYTHLEDLRPAQREMLDEEFKKVNAENPEMADRQRKAVPETTITTNIQPHGGNKMKPGLAKGKREVRKAVEPKDEGEDTGIPEDPEGRTVMTLPKGNARGSDKTCEYCGRFDANFTADSLDLHMYKLCPMLYLCRDCGNVVELLTLTAHRLKECVARKKYRECPVCKTAVAKERLDAHVQEGGCRSYDPHETILCPLCQEYIEPGTMNMWKDHVLVKGCGKNPRKNTS